MFAVLVCFLVDAARRRLISALESEIKDLDATLSHVSGADLIWLAHHEDCFSTVVREYTYEFCPFKQANQKSGGSTSLGRFTRFDSADGKTQLHFEKGQRCWQGMDRKAVVHTNCGVTSAITLVEEPSTCFYSIQFDTPIACSLSTANALRQEIEAEVHDSEL
jgi:protein kinase C substrate 80K-H